MCPWFKFNNLELALDVDMKFFASVGKGLKLKVRMFWRLIFTFVEVTGENTDKESFCPHSWTELTGDWLVKGRWFQKIYENTVERVLINSRKSIFLTKVSVFIYISVFMIFCPRHYFILRYKQEWLFLKKFDSLKVTC